MKRYIIGDIHGCSKQLEQLIVKMGYNPSCDALYSVGDVINKGPDSIGVLEMVNKYNIQCVLGNHDQLFLNICNIPKNQRLPKQNEFMLQFAGKEDWCKEIVSSWPLYIELDDILIVHAGLEPGVKHPSQMEQRILQTIRTWDGSGADLDNPTHPKWYECDSWDKIIMFGHWAKNGLVYSDRYIGLDTGCVYGGSLTAWCPEDRLFFEVKNQPV
jgi:predicted phosphodiesterase